MKYETHPYGEHASEFMHIYTPQNVTTETKIIILIHGGFWKYLYGLDIMNPLCIFFVKLGYFVVNIEYPRVGEEGTLSAKSIVESIFRAYSYCSNFFKRNRERIVIGHSAGGQLAMLVGAHNELMRKGVDTNAYVAPKLIIGLAPVSDVWRAYTEKLSDEEDAAWKFIMLGKTGETINESTKDDFDFFSPIAYKLECKLMLVHGKKDTSVPYHHSNTYYSRWRRCTDTSMILPEVGHMDMIDPKQKFWADILETIH